MEPNRIQLQDRDDLIHEAAGLGITLEPSAFTLPDSVEILMDGVKADEWLDGLGVLLSPDWDHPGFGLEDE